MTINYLTGEAPGEDTLDKEMDIRYLDNKRKTAPMVQPPLLSLKL